MAAPRVLILSGHGRYEDPWHDHAATSFRLAKLLEKQGLDVDIRGTFIGFADDLDDFDLVLVNGSLGRVDEEYDGTDADWANTHKKMRDWALAGNPVFVYHTGISAFRDSPYWNEEIVGGLWNRGVTYHPPLSDCVLDIVQGSHEIVEGLTNITVKDERYTLLEPQDHVTIMMTHEEKGQTHALAWVNEKNGVKVVYNALGHNVQSLEYPDHQELLIREISWLLGKKLPLEG